VLERLGVYVERLGRSLAREPGAGWLGGPTCRPDVFAWVYRQLLALYASPREEGALHPASPQSPTPARDDTGRPSTASIRALLLSASPAHDSPTGSGPGSSALGPWTAHKADPLHPLLAGALASLDSPPPAASRSGLAGETAGGACAGMLFLLSSGA
jgi:hypothetical protein